MPMPVRCHYEDATTKRDYTKIKPRLMTIHHDYWAINLSMIENSRLRNPWKFGINRTYSWSSRGAIVAIRSSVVGDRDKLKIGTVDSRFTTIFHFTIVRGRS